MRWLSFTKTCSYSLNGHPRRASTITRGLGTHSSSLSKLWSPSLFHLKRLFGRLDIYERRKKDSLLCAHYVLVLLICCTANLAKWFGNYLFGLFAYFLISYFFSFRTIRVIHSSCFSNSKTWLWNILKLSFNRFVSNIQNLY